MSKIDYTDKVALNIDPSISAINKCQATDMNSIKNAINQNGSYTTLSINSTTGVFYCDLEGTLATNDIIKVNVPSNISNVNWNVSVDNDTTSYAVLYEDGTNVKPIDVSQQRLELYFNGTSFILKQAKIGEILYNNSTGSNTSITLSSSAANYSYLEIYYKSNDDVVGFTRIDSPNNKTFATIMVRPTSQGDTSTAVYLKTTEFAINGTTISNSYYMEVMMENHSNPTFYGNNNIYIVKVVGYK